MIDISKLYGAEKADDNLRIDVGNNKCYNYVLEGSSDCGSQAAEQISINTMLLPIRYLEVVEGTENGAGAFTRSYMSQKRVFSFQVQVDEIWHDKLKKFQFLDKIYFNAKNKSKIEVVNLTVSDAEEIHEDVFMITITFEDPDIQEVSGCCNSAYEGSPFEDPCDDEGGGGDPDPNDPCLTFDVGVLYDGNAINATVIGGPATGSITYRWYYDATGSGIFTLLTEGAVSSVVPAGSGRYRVIAVKGGCQALDETLVQDECSLFTVVTSYQFGMISSQVIAGQGNPTYVWIFIDENANETTLPDTTPEIMPDDSGMYRLEVEDGACTGFDTIYVEVDDECDFDTIITNNNDGTYIINHDNYPGSDTPSYRWEKETLAGIVPYGTDQTITPDAEGLYRGYITLDGCEVGSYVLIIGTCINFKAYIFAAIPGASDYTLYAGAIDAPGAVNYTWYQWTSGMYVQIGTGSTVTTSQVGQVKLIATSGGCEKIDYTEVAMDYNDPWFYQKFILTGGEDHVEVDEFTLPDIDNIHQDRTAWLMQIVEDGVIQRYEHKVIPASLDRQAFSIDGQKVQFNPAYSRAGRVVVVKMRKTP